MPQGLAAVVPSGVLAARAEPLAPPRGFRDARDLRFAQRAAGSPWGAKRPWRTQAQKAGLRFERKVCSLLSECLPGFEAGPWFAWTDGGGQRHFCQPDGLCIGTSGLILFEVKIRTTPDAWWQLSRLYKPVVEKALGQRVLALVAINRSFDPAVPMPCAAHHLEVCSLGAIEGAPSDKLLTLTWRL